MAGEVFVARQDTLESVKGTVEDIDNNLGAPDYAGGGDTDVVAMIVALASAVTTLQSDIDSVKTAIAGIGGNSYFVSDGNMSITLASDYKSSSGSSFDETRTLCMLLFENEGKIHFNASLNNSKLVSSTLYLEINGVLYKSWGCDASSSITVDEDIPIPKGALVKIYWNAYRGGATSSTCTCWFNGGTLTYGLSDTSPFNNGVISF